MNWAKKLLEKMYSEKQEFIDRKTSKLFYERVEKIDLNDLVVGVLEKNKQIKNSFPITEVYEREKLHEKEEARAFRELVEACSKASEDAQQGISECEKVKQK